MANKRTQDRIKNNLGVIAVQVKSSKCRTPLLEKIDNYLQGSQYDHLADWEDAEKSVDYVLIRNRKPLIIYPFLRTLTDRLSAKLLGKNVYPTSSIEDDPETEELLKLILDSSHVRPKMLFAIKKFVSHGSVFVRFKLVEGAIELEHHNTKFCYPKFDDNNKLISIRIQYVFEDWNELDERGRPTEKWFKLELSQQDDILFDNPKFVADAEPAFQVESRNEHQLGFVQGEWFRTTENKHNPDGASIAEDLFDFIDSLNYNISQTDKAVAYGQDPQLVINKLDAVEVEDLIKSSASGWNMGRDGDAKYLEIDGSGVQRAHENKTSMLKDVQDVARITILDPEKIVGSAQSGKAMEVLHGPMIELINELRPGVEKGLINLYQKMLAALVIYNQRGATLVINMPPQFAPKSLDIKLSWPEIFPKTMQDLRDKVGVGVQAANANLVSRESILRWIAKDFDVEDIELEIQKINTQKEFNTFGF